MTNRLQDTSENRRGFCLTELSTFALFGGALGLSALLWLTILAVL